jgi:hypothetical protein
MRGPIQTHVGHEQKVVDKNDTNMQQQMVRLLETITETNCRTEPRLDGTNGRYHARIKQVYTPILSHCVYNSNTFFTEQIYAPCFLPRFSISTMRREN